MCIHLYIDFFFSIKVSVPQDMLLIESKDIETQICEPNYGAGASIDFWYPK